MTEEEQIAQAVFDELVLSPDDPIEVKENTHLTLPLRNPRFLRGRNFQNSRVTAGELEIIAPNSTSYRVFENVIWNYGPGSIFVKPAKS